MKKRIAGFLSLCLSAAVLASACAGQPTQQAQPTQASPQQAKAETPQASGKQTNLLMATAGTAGTYYPLGGAIARVLGSKISGLNITVQATGGSVENMRLLSKKETELALAQNDVAYYAHNAQGVFAEKNEKITNFSAIGVVYSEVSQIYVRADADIKSIADLKGKKVAVGPTGSGTEVVTRMILDAYGINYKDRKDVEPLYLSYAEAVQRFKDRQVDAVFNVLSVPAASVQEAAASAELRFLSIDEDVVKKLVEKAPFFAPMTVPADTYKGQAEFKTISLKALLAAHNDLDANLVYQITKVLYENKDEIGQIHAVGNQIDLKGALDGVAIPVHPGAEKYFKEKGISKK